MAESEQPRTSGGPRRRGRRGGRGRGRGPDRRAAPSNAAAPTATGETADLAHPEASIRGSEQPSAPAPSEESRPVLEAVASRVRELARDPAPPQSAIRQAVEHINEIVVSLQQLLDQMEEVLELTELAERQKSADEREIESLRRALRQIQRPRHEREERAERVERFPRRERPERPESAREETSAPADAEADAPPAGDESQP